MSHEQTMKPFSRPEAVPRTVSLARMHYLVVDDQTRLTDLVVRYLTESGHSAEGRYDGPSGLAAARDPRLDALVLDVMLPGMDGVEVCRTLRGEGVDVPVILLTARGAIPERVAGLDAGADDYMVKPFAMEELLARLRALSRRRPECSGRSRSATWSWTPSSSAPGARTRNSTCPGVSSRSCGS